MKNKAPINKAEGLLGDVNRLSTMCRGIPFGIEREQCYLTHVLPLMDELNALGYSVEWDKVAVQYFIVKDGEGWVHPTIRLRRLEP